MQRSTEDPNKDAFCHREMNSDSEDFGPLSSFFPRFNSEAGGFKRRMCVVKLDGCRFTIGKELLHPFINRNNGVGWGLLH